MAGVGRRGFAAAARAAMFAGSLPYPDSDRDAPPAMDGRHANAPKYLDINAAMNHVMRGECLARYMHFCIHSFVPLILRLEIIISRDALHKFGFSQV